MATHVILYTTRISERRYGDGPACGHYHDGFRDCCAALREAFEDDFLTFERSVDDVGLYLYQRHKGSEGKHSYVSEDYAEITHCPFCGAEIDYEEAEVVDEREPMNE